MIEKLKDMWWHMFPPKGTSFRITRKRLEEIEALRKQTDVPNYIDVVNESILVWSSIQKHLSEGVTFWAQTPDGEMWPVKFRKSEETDEPNSDKPKIILIVDNDNPDFKPK